MKYEEKLLLILNAINEAREMSNDTGAIHLYATRVNGLSDFDENEVWDILYKLEHQEKIIKVHGFPYSLNERVAIAIDDYLYNRDTYFTIKLLDTFDNWTKNHIAKLKPSSSLSFDKKTGKLVIGNKSVTFRREAFRTHMLSLLLANNSSKEKLWNWDEIIEQIEDTKDFELSKESKDRFYPACDGLQKTIAQKIGINDFLIFNNSTVQVNPKYLHEKVS